MLATAGERRENARLRGEPPVPEDEGLAPVAEQVGDDEDVELVFNVVPWIRRFAVVDKAVTSVIFLNHLLAKIFINKPE